MDMTEQLPSGEMRYRELSSGAIVDRTTNRIVARNITSEEGRAMVQKRWQKYKDATASRVLKEAQAIDPDIKTEEDAWALLVGKTFIAIMDSDKPRGYDLERVGRAMGAMPDASEARQMDSQSPFGGIAFEVISMLADLAGQVDRKVIYVE